MRHDLRRIWQLALFASALLPFAYGMSGWIYLAAAIVLNGIFLGYAVRLYVSYSDALARRTFRYSIAYLAALFAITSIVLGGQPAAA